MIDATNISRVFRDADKSIKELLIFCKAIIRDNKILLRTTKYKHGIAEIGGEKIFYSMSELISHYCKFTVDKIIEVKGIPVKIIGDTNSKSVDTKGGYMAISDTFKGLDIMPIRNIDNTLVIDYADINYVRAIPLSYILEGVISDANGAYIVSSNEALEEICRYPIPLFDKVLWSESKIG